MQYVVGVGAREERHVQCMRACVMWHSRVYVPGMRAGLHGVERGSPRQQQQGAVQIAIDAGHHERRVLESRARLQLAAQIQQSLCSVCAVKVAGYV